MQHAALGEELRGLRLSELRKRAAAAPVDEAALEAALDADEPKAAVVALLLRAAAEARRRSCASP